mmetsp:Transcript_15300/g.23039  ORF Transcript_15300/g.23039 Transcript_15300/m.23039 type:complete len:254 (+) Transcript_15300:49-810(+)
MIKNYTRNIRQQYKSAVRLFSLAQNSGISGKQITLWHSPHSRSLRCLWTMEEMGIRDYNLITMPFPPRVFHKDFLKANILGTIPYFEDGDSKMTESSAVCQYLVSKYGPTSLDVQPQDPDYASYLNWLHHADATLTFPQTIVLRYTLQEPGRADSAVEDYAKWYIARLRLLDKTLEDGRKYLVGDRFTIADICVSFALYLGQHLKVNDETLSSRYKPQTKAYLEDMISREAFLKSLAIQKQSLKDFKQAHEAK